MPLTEQVQRFLAMVTAGETVEAIERYYDEDVRVFENRELVRSGRDACIAYERAARASQPTLAQIRIRSSAVNADTGVVFLEEVVRFTSASGRPMRLEEVAVQRWEHERIVEERFYYDGFVDEGD